MMLMLLSLFILEAPAGPSAKPDQDQMIKAVRTASAANRAAVAFGSIDFKYSAGTAGSAQAILGGNWKDVSTATGRFAFDSKNRYYERIFSVADTMAHRTVISKHEASNTLGSLRVATNGKVTLLDRMNVGGPDGTMSHFPQIYPKPELFEQDVVVPLQVGLSSPGNWDFAQDVDRMGQPGFEDWAAVVEGEESVDGHQTLKVRFSSAKLHATRRYWIDLERGAMPLKIVDTDEQGKDKYEVINQNIKLLSDHFWFPFRQIIFNRSGRAKEVTVTAADFQDPPKPQAYEMEFPEPVAIIDNGKRIRYAPQKVWDLNRLPSPHSKDARKLVVAEMQVVAPAMPGERTSWSATTLWLFGVGVVLLGSAVGVALYARRG
jgi:hypothetical protein